VREFNLRDHSPVPISAKAGAISPGHEPEIALILGISPHETHGDDTKRDNHRQSSDKKNHAHQFRDHGSTQDHQGKALWLVLGGESAPLANAGQQLPVRPGEDRCLDERPCSLIEVCLDAGSAKLF
jgi:hypothetical protein